MKKAKHAGPLSLSKADIVHLFELLNTELAAADTHGEVYLVGGAVLCMALDARDATRDVDGWFKPTSEVRKAAARVAALAEVPEHWLNDAVKGWLSPRGTFDRFIEHSHLQVFVARPDYLLAMKCAAMRLGEEFHDLDDVRFLLRYLNITTAAEARAVTLRYFDETAIPLKTNLALAELLGG